MLHSLWCSLMSFVCKLSIFDHYWGSVWYETGERWHPFAVLLSQSDILVLFSFCNQKITAMFRAVISHNSIFVQYSTPGFRLYTVTVFLILTVLFNVINCTEQKIQNSLRQLKSQIPNDKILMWANSIKSTMKSNLFVLLCMDLCRIYWNHSNPIFLSCTVEKAKKYYFPFQWVREICLFL